MNNTTDDKLAYVRQLEGKITTTKSTLEKLKAERQQTMVAVQHEEIEHLEKYLDQADVDLKGLAGAAEEAWHELRESIDRLMQDISTRLQRLTGDSEDAD